MDKNLSASISAPNSITFDLIIPTFNRSDYLQKTIKSIEALSFPKEVEFRVIVVDNNSEEKHRVANEHALANCRVSALLLFEPKQGRSHALNTGLQSSKASLVGFVDDDETLEPNWLNVAVRALSVEGTDFVGGACLPLWERDPPPWLPALEGKFAGVVGWVEHGDAELPYDDRISLNGGNLVVRRQCFLDVGGFSTSLGRSSKGLMGGEETDLHRRLLERGYKGRFLPRLIIYHFVPVQRISFRYHLRWAFDAGRSEATLFAMRRLAGKKLFGIPGHKYERILKTLGELLLRFVRFDFKSPGTVAAILALVSFSGWLQVQWASFTKSEH